MCVSIRDIVFGEKYLLTQAKVVKDGGESYSVRRGAHVTAIRRCCNRVRVETKVEVEGEEKPVTVSFDINPKYLSLIHGTQATKLSRRPMTEELGR